MQSFHSDISIQRDGSLIVTETIVANFSVAKHGIFRDIPVRYDYDAAHERIYHVRVQSVTNAGGLPQHYVQSPNGPYTHLKIGSPSQTVTGVQTYVITYTVIGVLNSFADHDELYWNVNGAKWSVPTGEVFAMVHLEGGGLTQAQCYEGSTGSREPCNFLAGDDRAGFVTTRAIAPGEQLTIVAAIRKGVVSEPVPILRSSASLDGDGQSYFSINRWTLGGAVLILIAGAAVLFVVWWWQGRDRVYTTIYYLSKNPEQETRPLLHRHQIVVEYTPPERLRPAEMGLLLDERVDQKDVTATIIDLAVRGYLTIRELEKPWVLGRTDWKLTRGKDHKDLKPWERAIYDGLMGHRNEVLLSDLHTDYWGALKAAQQDLYDLSVRHGWFSSDPAAQRRLWSLFAAAVVGGGFLLMWWLAALAGAGIVGLAIMLVGVAMFPLSRSMPKRAAKGSELLRRILGFRLYIETAEKDRQRFYEQRNIFAEYLPYAIVFGCAEKWARVFGGIETEELVGSWYRGAGMYPVVALSGHLQDFSGAVAHTIAAGSVVAPGPQGHSGFLGGLGGGIGGAFGGGGFAGGGGGGGGGGAW